MTKIHPEISTVSMGRNLFAFSLVAGSLLVAESLAIHQPSASAHGRRRSPSWRLGTTNDNIRSSAPSFLLASSRSQSSADNDDGAIDAVNFEHDATIQNTSHSTTKANEDEALSMWPQMDDLDKRMMKIALPCIANFAINPLVGAVDLFWVNRMGNALAVAGQAAANQVFSSAFWIVSVLPSGKWLF